MRPERLRPQPPRPEPPRIELTEPVPLVLGFADLVHALGTAELHGRAIAIDGFLSRPHVPQADPLLVDQPGLCPDCSLVPVAAITLPGFGASALFQATATDDGSPDDRTVRIVGRLDFGFR